MFNFITKLFRELLCLCGKHTYKYDIHAKSDSLLRKKYWEGTCVCGHKKIIPFVDPFVK